jgi:phosphoglycolate phosphatase
MRLPSTIVFDLDGTLVDTGPDLTDALNHALRALGRPPVAEAAVRDMVGSGALRLIERGLAATGEDAEGLRRAMMPLFLEHYAANIAVRSRPYPGCAAALDALRAAGSTLAICTNKRTDLSRLLVDALGWSGRFAAIVGSDAVPARKPDPGHLLATIAAAGGDPADALFVGDTHFDSQAAQAAGVPFIAVGFGFAAEPVEGLGADAVIAHFDALIPSIAALPPRA